MRRQPVAATEQLVSGLHLEPQPAVGRAVEPEHVGAKVTQQHPTKRNWPDRGHFQDFQTIQGTAHDLSGGGWSIGLQ